MSLLILDIVAKKLLMHFGKFDYLLAQENEDYKRNREKGPIRDQIFVDFPI
jgi:hypothetical protein